MINHAGVALYFLIAIVCPFALGTYLGYTTVIIAQILLISASGYVSALIAEKSNSDWAEWIQIFVVISYIGMLTGNIGYLVINYTIDFVCIKQILGTIPQIWQCMQR